MDKNKRDLESLINSQKEQLTRYETRLKDVVTAYKGLLKEKEALEASLSALNSTKAVEKSKLNADSSEDVPNSNKINSTVENNETIDNLKLQISTLMNSLATLSAEKSRMESSFQADKKHIRADLISKDKLLNDLQDKLKSIIIQTNSDVENYKSKLIVEKHEHNKEISDNMLMIKELQKLLSDERHLKENIEMQLNNLKQQFTEITNNDELLNEVNLLKMKLKKYESNENNANANNINNNNNNNNIEKSNLLLQQLQNEIYYLKQQHDIAIKNEQKRSLDAELNIKHLQKIHEERVVNLETRLAELSNTVGTYDRLRQNDQENIIRLKEKLQQLNINIPPAETSSDEVTEDTEIKIENSETSVTQIINEIYKLKKLLIEKNLLLNNPLDISNIINIDNNDHTLCNDNINKSKKLNEKLTNDLEAINELNGIQTQHIKNLQEKIKVLNYNIDEQENELKNKQINLYNELKNERRKCNEITIQIENDYRNKINDLEQQLQKQRERSLQLLDEKENEIKILKNNLFIPIETSVNDNENNTQSDSNDKKRITQFNNILNNTTNTNNVNESYHMLHYVHEIARKDVEIVALRKTKHLAETELRQALQDKVTSQEELHDKIYSLEQQVDRLERCKSREGANLEYLKNVILSFLATSNNDGKRHMLNAIGAVLKFNPSEIKQINNYLSKK